MGFLSPMHWLVILVVAVLLFGNRLPEIARSVGRSVNEFKRGLRDVKDNFDEEMNSDPPPEKLKPPADNTPSIDTKEEAPRDVEQTKETSGEATKE